MAVTSWSITRSGERHYIPVGKTRTVTPFIRSLASFTRGQPAQKQDGLPPDIRPDGQ